MTVDSLLQDSRLPDPPRPAEDNAAIRWTAVCPVSRLTPDRGVAAQVGGVQVAIFRSHTGQVHAVGHRDPVSGAHVMSRGVIGSHDGRPTIASPARRYVYDLGSGECLDLPGVWLPVYRVRCRAGLVEVGIVEVG